MVSRKLDGGYSQTLTPTDNMKKENVSVDQLDFDCNKDVHSTVNEITNNNTKSDLMSQNT